MGTHTHPGLSVGKLLEIDTLSNKSDKIELKFKYKNGENMKFDKYNKILTVEE